MLCTFSLHFDSLYLASSMAHVSYDSQRRLQHIMRSSLILSCFLSTSELHMRVLVFVFSYSPAYANIHCSTFLQNKLILSTSSVLCVHNHKNIQSTPAWRNQYYKGLVRLYERFARTMLNSIIGLKMWFYYSNNIVFQDW